MDIILASFLLLFLNKEENAKYLACLLILYLVLIKFLYITKLPSFQDYLYTYTILTSSLCICVMLLTNKTIWYRVSSLSVVVPQLVYIVLMNKPYLISEYTPYWFLLKADLYFAYGVFLVAYDYSKLFNLKSMKLKDKLLNVSIVYCLVMF